MRVDPYWMGYNGGVKSSSGLGVYRRLRPHPSSVGEARRLIRDELAMAGREDLVDTAELLVSEVVTNALVHAGTPIDVTARVGEDGLRVEIGDGSAQLPVLRHGATLSGTGRGLRMLQRMVQRWGAHSRGDGKTVWFELETGDYENEAVAVEPDAPRRDGRRPRGANTVEVVLLNVPLLLHVAWREHVASLLREHLLFSLDDESTAVLQDHAAASEAVALLGEQLPDPGLVEDAEELMANAIEPGVSSPREVLSIPVAALENFRVLERTLDAALQLAEAGEFLTPPTQPEIRAFRGWICGEIERQSGGGAPSPWTHAREAAPATARLPLTWSPETVSLSQKALVAADDTNRIVAVSGSALDILRYADADELVGRRLVAIIPERFHQAHLAGFTLHLSTGRAPLLGRPVTVPVLCADGTEIPVELLVQSETLPGERRVFVAELRL